MAWDDTHQTAADPDNPDANEQITATEWNNHVTEGHWPADELNLGVDGGDPVLTDPQNADEIVARYDRSAGEWDVEGIDVERASIGGLPQVGDPYDAVVAQTDPSDPENTSYVYYNGGRRGQRGRTTVADLGGGLNTFYADYDGTDDTNVEDSPGVVTTNPGIHILQNEIVPRRGCYLIGPRYGIHKRGYKGGPTDPSGGTDEIICAIWTRDLSTSEVAVRCDPDSNPTDPKGASFAGLSFVGDDTDQDLVFIKNSDTHVFHDCKFAKTNGRGLFNSGGFATTTVNCLWQDCGRYASGGSVDKAAVLNQSDPDSGRSSNLKIHGGKLLGEESDAGVQVRAPQGISMKGGGMELSAKAENSSSIPVIEGQDMNIANCTVTGLNQTGPIGIRVNGGICDFQNVRSEKIGTGFEIDGFSDKETVVWKGIEAVGNAGPGIKLNGTGQLMPQTVGGYIADNGGAGIVLDSDASSNAQLSLSSVHFNNNTGYNVEDNRTGSQENSTQRFEDIKTDQIDSGMFDTPRYISFFSGDLDAVSYTEVTISSGSTTGTSAHGLYSEWDPIAATVTPTNANGIGDVVDVTSEDNDSDGYNEDVTVTVGSAPSADTDVKVTVFSEVVRGGDVAPGGTSTL